MAKNYSGVKVIENFSKIEEFVKEGECLIDELGPIEQHPNMLLVLKNGKRSVLAIVKGNKAKLVKYDQKIRNIHSRNKEQDMTIELLRDPSIECISIAGPAGCGKTLLALAFAMEQLESGKVNKVVLCKNFTPLGREIGYLKGDMDSKIRPWMGSFFDNFEVLGVPMYELDDMTDPMAASRKENPGRVEISPITFIQGRSISNAVIIVDESQNLTKEVIKQILTRPAENCKIILLGDLEQTIEKDARGTNSGFAAAIEAGKDAAFIGHITLLKSERSKLAEWFSKYL